VTQRKLDDGEIIYRAGDPSIAAYQVLEGAVELVRPGGGETPVTVRAGGMFGELGALDKSPRATTARASGPATIEVIDRETFLNALEEDPATAQRVMTRLVARLRRDPSGVFAHPLDGPPPGEPEPPEQGFMGGLRRIGRLLGLAMADDAAEADNLPALADARPMTGGILVLVAGLQGDADGVAEIAASAVERL